MVFYGEYEVSFTGVGRIVLPKKIRAPLKQNSFVLTKGFDSCLAGYEISDWEQRSQNLLNVSLLEKEHIEKRRRLFSSASYVEVDEQGRFVVPRNLMSILTHKKKSIIIGVGDHFEIWDPEQWQTYNNSLEY